MAELALVQLANRRIETFQDAQTFPGDPRFDYAAIIGLALTSDQAALFHAVEQAGHVRVVGDHAVADAAASQTMGFSAAQDAQDVVLRAGQAVRFEQLFGFDGQSVGGFLEGNEDLGCKGSVWLGWAAAIHLPTIVVETDNVKRQTERRDRYSGFAQGAQLDFTDEALRALGEDGGDGVGYVLGGERF